MLIDDDQDCVVIEVSLTEPSVGGAEASCHVGYRSCFYRAVPIGAQSGPVELSYTETSKALIKGSVGDTPIRLSCEQTS